MSEDYFRCPEEFQKNCIFFEVKCRECSAFSEENTDFFYKPIRTNGTKSLGGLDSELLDLSFKNHPYMKEKLVEKKKKKEEIRKEKTLAKKEESFQKKRKVVRAGYKTEKKVLNKLSAKSTLASGRINHDADGVLEVITDLKIGIEHKTRLNGRHTLGPTSEEWETAKNQGAKVFIVTSKEKGSIVTLELETFNNLIEIIQSLVDQQEAE